MPQAIKDESGLKDKQGIPINIPQANVKKPHPNAQGINVQPKKAEVNVVTNGSRSDGTKLNNPSQKPIIPKL